MVTEHEASSRPLLLERVSSTQPRDKTRPYRVLAVAVTCTIALACLLIAGHATSSSKKSGSPCQLVCHPSSWTQRLATSVGFHVYCVSKPCSAAFDDPERAQPESLLGTAGIAALIAAATTAFMHPHVPTPLCRVSCSVGAVAFAASLALAFAARSRLLDIQNELGLARAQAHGARREAARPCARAPLSLEDECALQPCSKGVTTEPESARRWFATPASCLATRLSRAARLIDERGRIYPTGHLPHLPRALKARRVAERSGSLPSRVRLQLPGVPPVAGPANVSHLCGASDRFARAAERPIRLLIIGDSRARNLAEELIWYTRGAGSAKEQAMGGALLSLEDVYPPAMQRCRERVYRYKHARFCGGAPPVWIPLCGGRLLLSYRACWLFEMDCMVPPEAEVQRGGPAQRAPADLVLLGAGLHDIVHRPPHAAHRAYMIRRLSLALRALQAGGAHAMWFTTQRICGPYGGRARALGGKKKTNVVVARSVRPSEPVTYGDHWSAENGTHLAQQVNNAVDAWETTATELATLHGWGVLDGSKLYGHCEWSADNIHFAFGGVTVGTLLARVISSPLYS